MIKKLTAFALLCLLSFFYFLSLLISEVDLFHHYYRLEEKLKKGVVEQFVFTQQELQNYLVEENEFRLDGKMYDIKKKEQQGNKLVVYCVRDEYEENTLLELQKFFGKQIPADKTPLATNLFKFLSLPFFNSLLSIVFFTTESKLLPDWFITTGTTGSFSGILTPPPRC